MRHQLYVLRSPEQTTVKARQLRAYSHRAEIEFCLYLFNFSENAILNSS